MESVSQFINQIRLEQEEKDRLDSAREEENKKNAEFYTKLYKIITAVIILIVIIIVMFWYFLSDSKSPDISQKYPALSLLNSVRMRDNVLE